MIKGLTFDLWDTVFIDDSDEPKRVLAGKSSKALERRRLVRQFLQRYQPVDARLIDAVYTAADAAFRKVWHDQHVTWTVRERLEVILKGLRRELPEADLAELIRLHEEMELEFRPDFVAGVSEALEKLHKTYRLGVISDAIFSPGRCLRTLLRDGGLLDYFEVFVFSDEFGFSKPEPRVFAEACRLMQLKPDEIAHIGDREHNDILGPKQFGMHAILCMASLDRNSQQTQADAVFADYARLPGILKSIDDSHQRKR